MRPVPQPPDPRKAAQERMAQQLAAQKETERLHKLVDVPQKGTPQRKLDLKPPVKVPTVARPGGAPPNIPPGVAAKRKDPPTPVTPQQMQQMGVAQKTVGFNPWSETYQTGGPKLQVRDTAGTNVASASCEAATRKHSAATTLPGARAGAAAAAA